ncbi:MAG: treZ [Acidimicrobiales bacterium]|nr:treZ [Acidimicrobiales bacterium]
MSTARVWAPLAESVELATPTSQSAMTQADGGWWESAEDLPADALYRFVVDGSPYPDPRSPRQPDGPNGWSQAVDHSAFEWTDQEWVGFPLPAAVLYELHVGTFSAEGTFDGAIAHLDHLVELGVTAIEIMPVATFPGERGWGYDGVNLYAPQETYGGPDGLRRLVDACHARRLAVVLDVVYNHLGPVGNSLRIFGPYFTDAYHSPWGDAVNLDGPGSDEVRRFIIDNALQWVLDYHVDGLRLDAVHALHDESAMHVLDELGQAVHAAGNRTGRVVWVIAESDLNDPRLVRSNEAYGYGLDAAWSDDFHHALHVTLTGEHDGYYGDFTGVDDLAEAIRDVYVFGGKFAPSRERTHGRGVGEMDRSRFVCFTQNHDQVGNRATGERLAHLVSTERAEIAAAVLLTSPFVPMLFQGEEWGASTPFQYFTDVDDEEVGNAVREGRRAEFAAFGWKPEEVPDPQDAATWDRSRLDWDERESGDHARLLDWHRRLIALRAEATDLRDGRKLTTAVHHDEGAEWMVVERGSISVVVNFGDPVAVTVRGNATTLLANGDTPEVCTTAEGTASLLVGRDQVAILRHD